MIGRSITQLLRRQFTHLEACSFTSFNHISNWNNVKLGQAKEQHPQSQMLPTENAYNTSSLERNEIESRMLKVCSAFEKIDLKTLNWSGHIERDLGLDSLERVALLTSFEHEFTTLWEDRVFDNLHSLDQIVVELLKDPTIY